MLAKWKSKAILLHKACLQTCMYVSRHTYMIKNALILTKYLTKHSVFTIFDLLLTCFLAGGSIFFDFFSLDERVCPKSMAPGSLKLIPLSRFRHVTFISSRRNRESVFRFSNVFTFSLTFFHQNLKFWNVSRIWLTFSWISRMYHWFCMLLAVSQDMDAYLNYKKSKKTLPLSRNRHVMLYKKWANRCVSIHVCFIFHDKTHGKKTYIHRHDIDLRTNENRYLFVYVWLYVTKWLYFSI